MKPILTLLFIILSFFPQHLTQDSNLDGYFECREYIIVRIDPIKYHIQTVYKNSDGEVIGDFGRLRKEYGNRVIFACNAGMFMEDLRPLGLYIENGNTIMPLNTRKASTNFYLQPNGVFYVLWDGTPGIKTTNDYKMSQIYPEFATQSGPMLTINGQINSKFSKFSESYRTRNGVGLDSNGKAVFILAKLPMNFYEFASLFILSGCQNSLFLDGTISDFYCPEKELGWDYGYMSPMIIVTK